MKTAKHKRPIEQRFPITLLLVPIPTLREALKAYLAFRGLGYHLRHDYKPIFLQYSTSTESISLHKQRRLNYRRNPELPRLAIFTITLAQFFALALLRMFGYITIQLELLLFRW